MKGKRKGKGKEEREKRKEERGKGKEKRRVPRSPTQNKLYSSLLDSTKLFANRKWVAGYKLAGWSASAMARPA